VGSRPSPGMRADHLSHRLTWCHEADWLLNSATALKAEESPVARGCVPWAHSGRLTSVIIVEHRQQGAKSIAQSPLERYHYRTVQSGSDVSPPPVLNDSEEGDELIGAEQSWCLACHWLKRGTVGGVGIVRVYPDTLPLRFRSRGGGHGRLPESVSVRGSQGGISVVPVQRQWVVID